MSYPLLIFLVVCVVSFIPVWRDHGDTWKDFKSEHGRKKFWALMHLLAIWVIPILSLVGTIFLGLETVDGNRQMDAVSGQLVMNSNKLSATEENLRITSNQVRYLTGKYDEATNDLLLASNAVADANAKLKTFRSLTPDRVITDEMKKQFISLTRNAPKGKILVLVDDGVGEEPRALARQINEMVQAAGYEPANTPENGSVMVLLGARDIPKGVFVGVWDATNHPPFATPLVLAMREIGLGAETFISTNHITPDTVKIWVGVKP